MIRGRAGRRAWLAAALVHAGCVINVELQRPGILVDAPVDRADSVFADAADEAPRDASPVDAPSVDTIVVDIADARRDAVDDTRTDVASDATDSGGPRWLPVFSGTFSDLRAIFGTGPNDVWTVGDEGTALHWDGARWTRSSTGTMAALRGVWGSSPVDFWAVGSERFTAPVVLHWNGGAWTRDLSATLPMPLNAVTGSSAADVWVVGGGGIGGTTDALHWDGSSWSRVMVSPTPAQFFGAWTISATNVWIAAGDGSLFHWDGSLWASTSTRAPLGPLGNSLWGESSESAFAIGGRGVLQQYNMGTWSTVSVGTLNSLRAVWGLTVEAWSVGDRGTVARRDPGTMTWTSVEGVAPRTLWNVWASSPSDVWAVGEAGTIVHYTR